MTTSTTTPALAAQARQAWQQQSIEDVLEPDVDAFMAVIAGVRPGELFTVNDVRASLDAVGIPAKARGGLFSAAGKAGLIAPYTVDVGGRTVQVHVPSTGTSAHAAMVRVYRRLP